MKQMMLSFLLFALVGMNSSFAQNETTRKKHFNLENGVAIYGYDPVAYFKNNKAEKGKKEFAYTLAGVTYYFSSAANKEEFKKTPEKFEPEYGGWCAYAMGKTGEKVEVDPKTFKIINGKLYLFYNKFFNNTLKDWNKDEAHLKPNADKSWDKIFKQ